jgi:membrane protease YdiL (CAAX protease family)
MEPQLPPRTQGAPQGSGDATPERGRRTFSPGPHREHDLSWVLQGEDGLRSGWAALFFVALYYLFTPVLDVLAVTLYPPLAQGNFSPLLVFLTEMIPLVAILAAGALLAGIQHRRIIDYNLVDAKGVRHFVVGLVAGFAALSMLVVALAIGGWLRFGPASLHAGPAVLYGGAWACAFLLVGLFEEGSFRCYLLSTLTRGISFWWALATVCTLCLLLVASSDPKGSLGVFLIAALGAAPCWFVHRSGTESSGFWQAAWTTSTAFGYFHTGNNGENWIGIFAASLIGFVFCVSVRVTGSAWWAIGCHAAWDWAETYFYGTPDSGFVAQRHLLSTNPAGNPLLSGGADGPEGSLLVVPVILLLLALLVLLTRRARQNGRTAPLREVPAQLSA